MPERTARLYMRLASNRDVIEQQNGNVADLTVRGAIALIAAPKKSEAGKYAEAVAEGIPDILDLDAFEESQRHSAIRREATAATDAILVKLIALGEFTADVDALSEELLAVINKDLLVADLAKDVPFDPVPDATTAILRARDLATEILHRVEKAA